MGCGCNSATESFYDRVRAGLENKFVPSKKQYTIIDVFFDEIFNRAKKISKYRRAKRLLKCFACDELFIATKQCKKCGCFVQAKVIYEKSSCPIGKW